MAQPIPSPPPPPDTAPRILPDGSIEIPAPNGETRVESVRRSVGEPPAPPEWLKDEDTSRHFLMAMRAMYDYRTSGFEHRRRVFEWQLLSARIIFGTVLVLVATGMCFAAIHFRRGLRRAPDAPDGQPEEVTQVEIGAASVKVASPVLGVVILVVSLAFFYLYLVYVYPIAELL